MYTIYMTIKLYYIYIYIKYNLIVESKALFSLSNIYIGSVRWQINQTRACVINKNISGDRESPFAHIVARMRYFTLDPFLLYLRSRRVPLN